MAQITSDNGTHTDTVTENTQPEASEHSEELANRTTIGKVLESRFFALAMNVAEKYASTKSKVYRILQHAFEKLREESNRKRVEKDFKEKTSVLVRMTRAYYNGEYKKLPTTAVFRIIGGLIYFIWVIDLIPDFIPILGLADDLAVIVWVYNGLSDEIEDFERWESAEAVSVDSDDWE